MTSTCKCNRNRRSSFSLFPDQALHFLPNRKVGESIFIERDELANSAETPLFETP